MPLRERQNDRGRALGLVSRLSFRFRSNLRRAQLRVRLRRSKTARRSPSNVPAPCSIVCLNHRSQADVVPVGGYRETRLDAAAYRELEVVTFREGRQAGVVECGPVAAFEQPSATRHLYTGLDAGQEVVLAEVTRTGGRAK